MIRRTKLQIEALKGDALDERIERKAKHEEELAEVTEQIGKPFPKEAEYQAKIARLAVLNAELDTEGRKNEQGGITQGNTPPVQGQGQGKKPKL